MEDLEPQLEHNREEFDQLRKWKRRVLIAMLPTAVVIVLLVPIELMDDVGIGVLVLAGVAMGYFEFMRLLVFRRDLRERREK